ncbi:MAG: hypothetical protein CMO70_00850 [Verrucomicrobiales bacterium]|nr:hypothetical protein [Verrucomicrobiales bacterium]
MNINHFYLKKFYIFALVIIFTGCSGHKKNYYGNVDYDWDSDGKSYTAIVKDAKGADLVRVDCRHIGNQPNGIFKGNLSRDFRSNHVDFYDYKLTNLSDKQISLESVDYRFDRGQYKKVFKRKTKAEIIEYMDGNVLPPNGSLERINSWAWGKFDPDVLHKIYNAKVSGGANFIIDVQLVCKK